MNSPLLDSVVVVLREVLEFSLLVGVLLVAGRCVALRARWLVPALLAGVAGAGLYGARLRVVSTWFDGVGYEVVNAGLQILVYVLILAVIGLWVRTGVSANRRGRCRGSWPARWRWPSPARARRYFCISPPSWAGRGPCRIC